MRSTTTLANTAVVLAVSSALAGPPSGPDTPLAALPPVPAAERRVGVAYTTWHQGTEWSNVWGTPELGFYASTDRAVIRHGTDEIAGVTDAKVVGRKNRVDRWR